MVLFFITTWKIYKQEGYVQQRYRCYLVVVLVAKCLACGVKNIPDLDIRLETVDVDASVKGQRVTIDVCAIDGGGADAGVLVLPDAEVTVNEAVMQPEHLLCISHNLDIEFFPGQLTGSAGEA
jgi:hypothetical protein